MYKWCLVLICHSEHLHWNPIPSSLRQASHTSFDKARISAKFVGLHGGIGRGVSRGWVESGTSNSHACCEGRSDAASMWTRTLSRECDSVCGHRQSLDTPYCITNTLLMFHKVQRAPQEISGTNIPTKLGYLCVNMSQPAKYILQKTCSNLSRSHW